MFTNRGFSILKVNAQKYTFSWLVGCRFESNCPLVRPGTIGGMPSVWGGLSKGS